MLFVFVVYPSATAVALPGKESLTVSPASLQLDSLDPGESVTKELTVFNDGTYDYDFRVYGESYAPSGGGYDTKLATSDNPRAQVSKWVTVDTAKKHLKAGETTKVQLTITVPKNASPGSNTGAVVVEIVPPESSGIVAKKRVAMPLFANVSGNVSFGGRVVDVSIPFWQFTPPLKTSLHIENTGNAFFLAKVKLKAEGMFGAKSFEEEREYVVVPDQPRAVLPVWSDAPSLGLFQVSITTDVLGKVETSSGYVLMMPFWLLLFIPVLIAATFLYRLARPSKGQVKFRRDHK